MLAANAVTPRVDTSVPNRFYMRSRRFQGFVAALANFSYHSGCVVPVELYGLLWSLMVPYWFLVPWSLLVPGDHRGSSMLN